MRAVQKDAEDKGQEVRFLSSLLNDLGGAGVNPTSLQSLGQYQFASWHHDTKADHSMSLIVRFYDT